ncbi:hypothetical protein Tco_0926911 [Tanacetum coccineum]|uniref:Reverse transcriptase domain-containing protein n=1 Tax=Tanacetum coccineum TaxID=301880 RepID=A0ABQ5DBY4_9ASTR
MENRSRRRMHLSGLTQPKLLGQVSPAWDRFKDVLRACPYHGFTELHQLDTFYNSLTSTDQDSLNAAAGGNLLTKTPKDALTIIENKSKVHTSRNRPVVANVSTNASTSDLSPDVAALIDAVKALLLKNTTPPLASVKAVEESCVTCGGPHPYYQCLATDGNAFPGYQDNIQTYVSAAAVNYNQRNTGHYPPSVAHQVRPPVECLALADLGASINLMPLSIWRKLLLPELTPTQMILSIAELVYSSPNRQAKLSLFGNTSRYSYNDVESINRIDVIDVACEEYSREVLGISDNSESGNPTPISEPVISKSSPSFTPFEGGDFILEEIEAYLASDSVPPGIDDAEFDPEGDIRLIEEILNNDPYSPLPPKDLKEELIQHSKGFCISLSLLEFLDATVSIEDANLTFHKKLPSVWHVVATMIRGQLGLDVVSLWKSLNLKIKNGITLTESKIDVLIVKNEQDEWSMSLMQKCAFGTSGLGVLILTGENKVEGYTSVSRLMLQIYREEKTKGIDQALKERDDFKYKLEEMSNASVLQNEVLNQSRYVSDSHRKACKAVTPLQVTARSRVQQSSTSRKSLMEVIIQGWIIKDLESQVTHHYQGLLTQGLLTDNKDPEQCANLFGLRRDSTVWISSSHFHKSVSKKKSYTLKQFEFCTPLGKISRDYAIIDSGCLWSMTGDKDSSLIFKDVQGWSKGRTVADSIAERLTRPTAYKFKTDCSIIPVWTSEDVVNRILQVVLDLQHFKSSLVIFAATILQSSSAIHHISNIDNYVHQIIEFQSILITSSYIHSQNPGVVSPLATRQGIDELAIRNKVNNQEKIKSSQPEIDRNKVIIEDWVDSDDEETDFSESQKETFLTQRIVLIILLRTAIYMKEPSNTPKLINLREHRVQSITYKGWLISTAETKNDTNSTFQSTAIVNLSRMDSRRPRISSYLPSSRSSTTRTPNRPQRLKKIVKSIWVKKGSTVGSQAVLPQTVKKSAMISPKQTWKPKGKYLDSVNRGNGSYTLKQFEYGNPEEDLKDYAIIDSGCSGSMTGDKNKLSDFKDYKG